MCSQPHNQWDHEPTWPCRSSSCFLNLWAGSSIALIDTKYRGVSSLKMLSAKPRILSFNICTNYGTEGQSGNHGKQLHPTYMPHNSVIFQQWMKRVKARKYPCLLNSCTQIHIIKESIVALEDAQSAMPTREVPLLLPCLTFELKNKSKPDIKTMSGSVVTNLMVNSFHQLHSVTTSALK